MCTGASVVSRALIALSASAPIPKSNLGAPVVGGMLVGAGGTLVGAGGVLVDVGGTFVGVGGALVGVGGALVGAGTDVPAATSWLCGIISSRWLALDHSSLIDAPPVCS